MNTCSYGGVMGVEKEHYRGRSRIGVYPGQYYDGETGLHYNFHRYYEPGSGRYLRVDPVGFEGGYNWYLYTGANSVNFDDAYGLQCRPNQVMKDCLGKIFGENIDSVNVYDNSWTAKAHFSYATTRKNAIYVDDTCDGFWTSRHTVLEEYYHVLRQWNREEVSVTSYAIELIIHGYERKDDQGRIQNKYEREAKEFADANAASLKKCLECPDGL